MFIDVLLQGKSLEGHSTQIQNTKHTLYLLLLPPLIVFPFNYTIIIIFIITISASCFHCCYFSVYDEDIKIIILALFCMDTANPCIVGKF